MTISQVLLGSALGLGARVLQGMGQRNQRRGLEDEFNQRLMQEFQRRQAQAPQQPLPQAEPEADQQLLGQEFDRRLVQAYENRLQQTYNLLPPDALRRMQQMWTNARGDINLFINWLSQDPEQTMQQVINNPGLLRRVVETLQQQPMNVGEGMARGVSPAPIGSSNVKGFSYDRNTGDLMVQFHGGGLYRYGGVPKEAFENFASGNAAAKTSGSNSYGSWYPGKKPSTGAAHWEYIRDNFPYERLN
jgi:hypothetical protein